MTFSLATLFFIAGASVALPAMAQVSPAESKVNEPYKLSFTTGADYSSGSYGASSDTRILVAPLLLAFKTDDFRLSASIPYLRIDGPGGVVVGADGRPLPGVPSVAGARSGLGDLSLAGTYSLPKDSLGGFEVDLTGRVKFPTSKTSEQLGTGKTDYAVSADVSYPIGDWAPFVTLGYRMPGDPAGVNLKNTFTSSVGTSVAMGHTVVIVSYDYNQASSPLAKDGHELFGAVSAPATDRVNVTAYGIAGLSDGSPDYEAGLLLTVKLR